MPVTPYMAMTLPAVSATLGPQWATDLNDALTVNDAHDHSTGKGVPVRPAGLYMDADLNFRGTNPENMRSARFALQGSLLGGIDDVCCLYFQGADLYTNDAAGNQIQLTTGGGIAGAAGSIAGLVSPASVVYTPASKIFNFYSGSLVRAALACGPLTIADAVASGKGVTISAPSGLTANYNLELPSALPATTQVLTVSSAGLIAASGVPTPVAAGDGANKGFVDGGGLILSSSSGAYSTIGDTSEHDITNLSASYVSNGRPVMIFLQPDGSGDSQVLELDGASYGKLRFYRGSTELGRWKVTEGSTYAAGGFQITDQPAAGTYTYKATIQGQTSSARLYVLYVKLVVVQI